MVIKPTVNYKRQTRIDLEKSLKELAQKHVLVGIQDKDSSRPGEPVNNAELAFLHTEGSPAQRIPARPFLQPSVVANQDIYAKRLKYIIDAALQGDAKVVVDKMNQLGIIAARNAQGWFTDPRNNWTPNAPLTILLKGSDQPLIDTGDLRRAITYAVVED